MRRIILTASLIAMGAAAPGAAWTQNYPVKTVRVIVGFTAGGGADLIARLLAQKLTGSLGQPVVVETRPGAAGNIAAELVARAAPDGYTLLYGNASLSIAPAIFRKLAYDPVKDLSAISMAASYPYVLASHPSLPVRSVKEMVALAKRKPGALDYASGGYGTLSHLAMEMMRLKTGIELVQITYQGGGPALVSLMSGETQIGFVLTPIAAPYIKAGKMSALGVTARRRSSALPHVPTMQEAGIPDFEVLAWNGFLAPARTPEAILDRLQREMAKLVASTEVIQQFEAIGATPVGNTRTEFAAFVQTETQKWTDVAKRSGSKLLD